MLKVPKIKHPCIKVGLDLLIVKRLMLMTARDVNIIDILFS